MTILDQGQMSAPDMPFWGTPNLVGYNTIPTAGIGFCLEQSLAVFNDSVFVGWATQVRGGWDTISVSQNPRATSGLRA